MILWIIGIYQTIPNGCLFQSRGRNWDMIKDICGAPIHLRDGHICVNTNYNISIVFQSEMLKDALDTMDILFIYDGLLDIPLKKEQNFFVIRNEREWIKIMKLCEQIVHHPIMLDALFRPKSTFYIEDRRLCSMKNANLNVHCDMSVSIPIHCDARHVLTHDDRSPNFDFLFMPLYLNISNACITNNGGIYRKNNNNDEFLQKMLSYGCGDFQGSDDPKVVPKMVEGTVLAMAATWSSAYYHWMGESLPRGVLASNVNLIHTGKAQKKYAELASALFGINTIYGDICAPHVLWPIPATCGNGIPSLINTFRKQIPLLTSESWNKHDISIVYIHRPRGTTRHFEQYRELMEKLSSLENENPRAILTLYFDHDDPIPIFQRADCIVGPHGAGFVNLMFAKKGTPVVEILYSEDTSVGYLPFSLSLGHEWHGFVAEGSSQSSLRFGSDKELQHFLKRTKEICLRQKI